MMYHPPLARRKVLGAVVLGLASLVLAADDSRAGTLIINITDGVTSYDIFDQLPPDVNPGLNHIQADTSGLIFPNFNIVGLNASSNNPGDNDPFGAVLTIQAHIQRTTGGLPAFLSITTYQTDFSLPSGSKLKMISTTSSSYSNIPTGSVGVFGSWYNPSSPAVPPPPFGTPAPTISKTASGTGSGSQTTMLSGLPGSSDFSLTNQLTVVVGGAIGTTLPDFTIEGQTQILTAPIPEPASVILLGTAAPIALVLLSRLRRVRK
jgi:hypothetical protein